MRTNHERRAMSAGVRLILAFNPVDNLAASINAVDAVNVVRGIR